MRLLIAFTFSLTGNNSVWKVPRYNFQIVLVGLVKCTGEVECVPSNTIFTRKCLALFVQKHKWGKTSRFLATIQYQCTDNFTGDARKETYRRKNRKGHAYWCDVSRLSQYGYPMYIIFIFRLQYTRVDKLGDDSSATKIENKKPKKWGCNEWKHKWTKYTSYLLQERGSKKQPKLRWRFLQGRGVAEKTVLHKKPVAGLILLIFPLTITVGPSTLELPCMLLIAPASLFLHRYQALVPSLTRAILVSSPQKMSVGCFFSLLYTPSCTIVEFQWQFILARAFV